MKKLKAESTIDERVEDLHWRMRRINPRKNVADSRAAIRAAFNHLLGSLAVRDDDPAPGGGAAQ